MLFMATTSKEVKSKAKTSSKSTTKSTKSKGKGKGNPHPVSKPWLNSPITNPKLRDEGIEPGDNSKMIQMNMELFNLPDINLRDVNEVQIRLNEYFQLYNYFDMKPTVSGMAIALGMSRQTLWAIANDKPVNGAGCYSSLPKEVSDCIKKAYRLLDTFWEACMNSGKVNPVAGIFLGKNNFGYQDKQEVVLTPNNPLQGADAQEIADKYKELPDD